MARYEGSGGSAKYTHDGLDVILDDDAGMITKYLNGPGIDNKLRSKTGVAVNYFLADHLGSTNGLTDANGSLTVSNSYDAFGNPRNAAFPTRYQFTGREYDPLAKLQFSRARFYDPKLGRFISEDPIGFAGGDVNFYGYVWNDPLHFGDPTGLSAFDYYDNPYDLIPEGGWTAVAYVGNFAAGFGDHVTTIPFTEVKLTKEARNYFGSDDVVETCSGIYQAGGWAGFVWEIAAGGAAGLRAAATRGAGMEFSHWIPARLGGSRSLANGNYVTIAQHALSDPFRYRFMPRSWKSANPLPSIVTQQWHRIPKVFKGLGGGAVVSASKFGVNDCTCE